MQRSQRKPRKSVRRRGIVAVQVAVCSTILFGMAALVVDIARLYTTQTELQVAADAAALAAAANLTGSPGFSPQELALQAADEFAHRNTATGYDVRVYGDDLEFGRAVYNPSTEKYSFQSGGTNFDAVRVVVRHSGASGSVRVPFLFAPLLGKSGDEVQARASAVLIPRDIAVVIDLSGSMNDDSELTHYKQYPSEVEGMLPGIQINLRDIWCALDGPEPQRPYVPGAEDETEYATDTGPTIGVMNTWGNQIVPETYDPATDPGLWYLKKSTALTGTTLTAVQASLAARSYTADEISCLVSTAKDSSYTNQAQNRFLVILGLANWKSGRPSGHAGGNGDAIVQDSEVVFVSYPSWRVSWTWRDYMNYVTDTNTMMYARNSAFRYRHGLKTFVNFLLEREPQYNQASILWQTPEQPVRAVKDAVNAMTQVILGLDSLDQMSLEVFATTARHEVNLSQNVTAVSDRLYHMQAGHYNTTTNIGGGLLTAMSELSSARARASSAKVIVLMSDGKPNIDENGNYLGGGSQAINDWIIRVTQQAADRGIRVYTISVGADVDEPLMAQIATVAGGQHFHAEGTPAEYSDQLDMIFRSLGGKRPVALIE